MPASFFDSNIIIYLTSGDERKATLAEHLIAAGGTISVQVLNEIASVTRRKLNFTWAEVGAFILPFRSDFAIVDLTQAIHENGLRLAERHGFAIYDAMIVASACRSIGDRDGSAARLASSKATMTMLVASGKGGVSRATRWSPIRFSSATSGGSCAAVTPIAALASMA